MTPSPKLVSATRHVRTMRGGAQAQLLEAADEHYVVKFLQNPQGSRILVNEFISWFVLSRMGILTPDIALVTVDDEFLERSPECAFDPKRTNARIKPGVHFGSRYPRTSGAASVYDLFPSKMLPLVHNVDHFLGVLVFDQWASNADGRQAIFFVTDCDEWGDRIGPHWVAAMIDNGYAFQGQDWVLRDSPSYGTYRRYTVYGEPILMENFEAWLEILREDTRDIVDEIFPLIPREWIGDGEAELLDLLRGLHRRRDRVPALVRQSVKWMNDQRATSPQAIRRMPAKAGTVGDPLRSGPQGWIHTLALA